MVDLRRAGVMLISRIHAPEPAAASLRLAAVEADLADHGVPVRVLTTTPPPGQEINDPDGVCVSRWPALRDGEGQLRGYLPYMSFDIPLLLRVLTARSPGTYLVEPPPTTGAVMRVMASLLKRPYVWYAADIWSDATEIAGAPAPVVRVVRWLEQFALRGASGVVAVSPGVAERARELGARYVRVVPNGIDTDLFHPGVSAPSAAEYAAAGVRHPYFVYAGTASEWQGADIFVTALRRLLDAGQFSESGQSGQ
ncbi:MAG: glycosyltransferase, partial [Bowdeniella nasicola]|nr:glycosyltransferase [Bowdeniella nasicola]